MKKVSATPSNAPLIGELLDADGLFWVDTQEVHGGQLIVSSDVRLVVVKTQEVTLESTYRSGYESPANVAKAIAESISKVRRSSK